MYRREALFNAKKGVFLIFSSVALVNEVQPRSYESYLSLRTSKAYTAPFGGVKCDSSDRLFRVILAVGLGVAECFHWYYYRLSGYKEKVLAIKLRPFAVRTRLELVTSCVTGRHSNQLN